jgi:hypothetical protein
VVCRNSDKLTKTFFSLHKTQKSLTVDENGYLQVGQLKVV